MYIYIYICIYIYDTQLHPNPSLFLGKTSLRTRGTSAAIIANSVCRERVSDGVTDSGYGQATGQIGVKIKVRVKIRVTDSGYGQGTSIYI